jgi:hypothetical protein
MDIFENALKKWRMNQYKTQTRETFEETLKESMCRMKYNQMIHDIEKIEDIIQRSEWKYEFDDEIEKIMKVLDKMKNS